MVRRLLLLTVLAAGLAGVAAPRLLAAGTPVPPCPDTKATTLSSAHFLITYDTDPSLDDAITQKQAGGVLAGAERAYAVFTGLGFPAPLTSVGGKTEIDIVNLSAASLSSENCAGAIDFDSTTVDTANQDYSISWDVFSEITQGEGVSGGWLPQGLASWAAWKSLGYPAHAVDTLGPWDMSLDCYLSSFPSTNCDAHDGYTNLGLSRWPFYEYLDETYGTPFLNTVILDDAAAVNALTGLSTALASKGTTLADAYAAFTTKLLQGGWTATPLNTALPPITGSPVLTGATTGDTPTLTVGVDHLATRYVEIDRGDGKDDHKCYSATLTIKVTIPAGVTAQPVFYWAAANQAPVPLTIAGQNATATVPWDTCKWSTKGYLSLPNTGTTVDGANFTVSTHIDVSTTEVTATPPSAPANGYGNATDVSTLTAPPSISVFGPLVLQVPATATQLEVVVQASDQGSVAATLGSLSLGSRAIVPGTNVVKLALPAGVLAQLRSSASAAANVLTLTPVSGDGKTTGTPVSMQVTLKPAAKPAPKAKPKPKKKKKTTSVRR